MPKNNRCGQSTIFTASDLSKLYKVIKNPDHKRTLMMLQYTGERVSAVCRLRVIDVYADPENRIPADYIFFPAWVRKADPSGKRESLSVPMNENLAAFLSLDPPPNSEWMFPSSRKAGQPISSKSVDKWFRQALDRAGLGNKGYSLHSTRRTFITMMVRSGVPLTTIQKITGHKSLESLKRYVETDPQECIKAVNRLTFGV